MSYILDALKKMEHEKAKKKGTAEMRSISAELFRPEKFKQKKERVWIMPVSVVLAAVFASAMTWYLLKDSNPKKAQIAPNDTKAAVAERNTVAPSATVTTPPPQPAPVVAPVPTPTPVAAPAPVIAPVARANSAKKMPVAVKTGPDKIGSRRGISPAHSQEESGSQSMPPPADIKVFGIAWQDERMARRAVVNGFLLKEGAVVGGARITEILPEKVRFTMSGRTFEVLMQSAITGSDK